MNGLQILGTGRALPRQRITNDDLSKRVDTSDEWIRTRTGIESRYFCTTETNTDLACAAAQEAIRDASIQKEEIGAVIVATFIPEYRTPSTACLLQRELGLPTNLPAFDLNAACSGFIYALQVARGLLLQGDQPYALVVGSETVSRVLDPNDRSTLVLFGDGAGAAVVGLSDRHPYVSVLGARGDHAPLYCKNDPGAYLQMNGREVFRFAVTILPQCIDAVLQKAGLTIDQIDVLLCHQANARIFEHVAKKKGWPMELFYKNLDRYGNTSAASIPIALDELRKNGIVGPHSRVLCAGFGAGFTWGGALLTI